MDSEFEHRSVGDLAKQLSADVSRLARDEVRLAKVELAAKARALGVGSVLLGVGVVFLLVMVGTLAAAAVLAVSTTLPAWLSALIVAAVAAVLGLVMVSVGVRAVQRSAPPVPTETVESVKEDVAWVKAQAKSGMK